MVDGMPPPVPDGHQQFPTSSLLLISLGPVQSFIVAGRRGQDLWAGSQLLSDLAREMALSLKAGGNELIFPGGLNEQPADDEDERPSVANKILAQVTGDPKVLAEQAIARAMGLLEARFNALFVAQGAYLDVERARRQVLGTGKNDGMFEVFWVALPLGADNYAQVREDLEGLLAARKNTRDWGPVGWGARLPKSPIDGERETVVKPWVYERQRRAARQGNAPEEKAEALRKQLGIEPLETLDGPGMLKRLQQIRHRQKDPKQLPPRIHGTAHMAASPVLHRIERMGEAGRQAIDDYREDLRTAGVEVDSQLKIRVDPHDGKTTANIRVEGNDGNVTTTEVPRAFAMEGNRGHDGIFLFEGRLDSLADFATDEEQADYRKKAKDAHRRCMERLGLSSEGPTPYYALLQADGDHMGRALDHLAHTADGLKAHQDFSEKLETQFAQPCRVLFARLGGSLIYAGGDDVLALLPLHTLLDAIDELQRVFHEAMRRALPDGFPEDKRPTLSVGVALCHHLDPMFDAREAAQRAEKLAKSGLPGQKGRNNLAIIMDKRSGNTVEVCAPFGTGFTERLRAWIRFLDQGRLPDGVAYELEALVKPFELAQKAEKLPPEAHEPLRALVRRTLSRKKAAEGELDGDVLEQMKAVLDQPNPHQATLQLSREIQIARLLLKALNDARPQQTAEVPA